MTPAGEIIRDEIARTGPIRFSRFMELALYHPEVGYYRRARDPFGRAGDFYTAEQLQPVFGRILRQYARQLTAGMTPPLAFVELGAGREELREFFDGFDYTAIDVDRGAMPARLRGVIFGNEFLDALPVDVVVQRGGELRQVRVAFENGSFQWMEAELASDAARQFVDAAAGTLGEGSRIEVNLAALEWLDHIEAELEAGFVLFIDYGFSAREVVRFPEGTLMSYVRHRATPDVLANPGEQDITAHVAFSAVEKHAAQLGLRVVRNESMASMLLRAGESDEFRAALQACDEREALRLRMQLKHLLFGMGETFRALLLAK